MVIQSPPKYSHHLEYINDIGTNEENFENCVNDLQTHAASVKAEQHKYVNEPNTNDLPSSATIIQTQQHKKYMHHLECINDIGTNIQFYGQDTNDVRIPQPQHIYMDHLEYIREQGYEPNTNTNNTPTIVKTKKNRRGSIKKIMKRIINKR